MDTFAALTLATDYPSKDILKRPPANRKSNLITGTMWKMILGQASFQFFVLLLFLFQGADIFGLTALKEANGIFREGTTPAGTVEINYWY